MTIGAGYYTEAGYGMAVVVILLISLKYIQNLIDKVSSLHTYRITIPYNDEAIERYEAIFREHHLRPMLGKQIKQGDLFTVTWRVQGAAKNHKVCSKVLLNDASITELVL